MTAAEASVYWRKLAEDQPGTPTGRNRAEVYRRTAEALRLEAETGVSHCTCCLKPMAVHKGGAQ